MAPETQPYGLWPSTFDSATAASLKVSVSTLRSWRDDLFWIEGRPELSGRRVVVRWDQGAAPLLVSPDSLSLSSRVHEYGGGAFDILDCDGPLIAGIHEDQSLVTFRPGDRDARQILASTATIARGGVSAIRGSSWVVFIEESEGDTGVVRSLVACNVASGLTQGLVGGRDFYADPGVNRDRNELAWCCWDHPSMPWEAGEIWTAPVEISEDRFLVGEPSHATGELGQPASRPSYAVDGSLLFLSEQDGWARPWRRSRDASQERLSTADHDFGGPMLVLGERQLVDLDGRQFSIEHQDGFGLPVELLRAGNRTLDVSATSVDELCVGDSSVAWISPTQESLASVGVARGSDLSTLSTIRLGPDNPLGSADISRARAVSGTSRHGGAVYGLFYEPANALVQGPDDERPPVVVFCHGGPTSSARAGFDPIVQAMTTRGFAVVAINYGGSTGYGAPYRHRLDEKWGIVDVEDCVDLIASLGEQGLIDPMRAGIRGGSAGGFTALLGLTTGAFRCAVSWYGVADLVTLAKSTHDFESRYLDTLVGQLPQETDRYVDRSPVTRAPEMSGAVLLLQGLDDPVVPPDQARSMAAALMDNGHEVSLLEFEGESHGFRRLDTLTTCIDAEIAFYQSHLCQGFG